MDRCTDQQIDRKNGKEGKQWHSFQGNVFSEKEGVKEIRKRHFGDTNDTSRLMIYFLNLDGKNITPQFIIVYFYYLFHKTLMYV